MDSTRNTEGTCVCNKSGYIIQNGACVDPNAGGDTPVTNNCPKPGELYRYTFVRAVGPTTGTDFTPEQCKAIVKDMNGMCYVLNWDASSNNYNETLTSTTSKHPIIDCDAKSFKPDFYISFYSSLLIRVHLNSDNVVRYNYLIIPVTYGQPLPNLPSDLGSVMAESPCSTLYVRPVLSKIVLSDNTKIVVYDKDGKPQFTPSAANLPVSEDIMGGGTYNGLKAIWSCQACPSYSTFNTKAGKCVCGTNLTQTENGCECEDPHAIEALYGACKTCEDGYTKDANGKCQPDACYAGFATSDGKGGCTCWAKDATYQNGTCTCPTGYKLEETEHKKCIENCKLISGSTLNTTTGKCDCPDGQERQGNECVAPTLTCSINDSPKNENGTCKDTGPCACDGNIFTTPDCLWRTDLPAECIPSGTQTGTASMCPSKDKLASTVYWSNAFSYPIIGPSTKNFSIPGQCMAKVKDPNGLCSAWFWNANADHYSRFPEILVDCYNAYFNPKFYIKTDIYICYDDNCLSSITPYIPVIYDRPLPSLLGLAKKIKPKAPQNCPAGTEPVFAGIVFKDNPTKYAYDANGSSQLGLLNSGSIPNTDGVSVYDGLVSKWTCKCKDTNATYNGNSCQCNTDYEMVNGVCVHICPDNSTSTGTGPIYGHCTCNAGYKWNGEICDVYDDCPSNSTWNTSSPDILGYCKCDIGWGPNDTGNYCSPKSCPANSTHIHYAEKFWNGKPADIYDYCRCKDYEGYVPNATKDGCVKWTLPETEACFVNEEINTSGSNTNVPCAFDKNIFTTPDCLWRDPATIQEQCVSPATKTDTVSSCPTGSIQYMGYTRISTVGPSTSEKFATPEQCVAIVRSNTGGPCIPLTWDFNCNSGKGCYSTNNLGSIIIDCNAESFNPDFYYRIRGLKALYTVGVSEPIFPVNYDKALPKLTNIGNYAAPTSDQNCPAGTKPAFKGIVLSDGTQLYDASGKPLFTILPEEYLEVPGSIKAIDAKWECEPDGSA